MICNYIPIKQFKCIIDRRGGSSDISFHSWCFVKYLFKMCTCVHAFVWGGGRVQADKGEKTHSGELGFIFNLVEVVIFVSAVRQHAPS